MTGTAQPYVHRIICAPKKAEHPQRLKVFRTRCTIDGKVFDIIIDGCSSDNIISLKVVKKLGLPTEPQTHPYRVGWITNNIDVKITEFCKVFYILMKFYVVLWIWIHATFYQGDRSNLILMVTIEDTII